MDRLTGLEQQFDEISSKYKKELFKSRSVETWIDQGDGTFRIAKEYSPEDFSDFLNRVEAVNNGKADDLFLTVQDFPLFIHWLSSGYVRVSQSQIFHYINQFFSALNNPVQKLVYTELCLKLIQREDAISLQDDSELADILEDLITELGLTIDNNLAELLDILNKIIDEYRNARSNRLVPWLRRNALRQLPKEINFEYYVALLEKIKAALTQENRHQSDYNYFTISEFFALLRTSDLKSHDSRLHYLDQKIEDIHNRKAVTDILNDWIEGRNVSIVSKYLDEKLGETIRERLKDLRAKSLDLQLRKIELESEQGYKYIIISDPELHKTLDDELKIVEPELAKLEELAETTVKSMVKLQTN